MNKKSPENQLGNKDCLWIRCLLCRHQLVSMNDFISPGDSVVMVALLFT